MDEKSAYSSVARRAISSSVKLATAKLQESSAFHAYHAFESLGGELCVHYGQTYPRKHPEKIKRFLTLSRRSGNQRGVAEVAITLNSLDRNLMLYPRRLPTGAFEVPSNRLTVSDAKDLVRRVKGIRRVVSGITGTK